MSLSRIEQEVIQTGVRNLEKRDMEARMRRIKMELENQTENRITYKAYLHRYQDSNYEKAVELGLDNDEKFMDKFVSSLYEVEFDMEVDTKTGESWILGINGVKLEEPVKG